MKKLLIGLALALGLIGIAYAQSASGGLSINAQTATSWLLDRYNTTGTYVDSPISVSQSTGQVTLVDGVVVSVKTVATLPTCNASYKGTILAVSDATTPTYNGALTGGGAVVVPVFCSGASWTSH
jgi:hypothetical protein